MYKEYATPQDLCETFCRFKENDMVILTKDVRLKTDNGIHIITKGVQAVVKAVSFNEKHYRFPTLFKEDFLKYNGITDERAFVITLCTADNAVDFECYGDEIIPYYENLTAVLKARKTKEAKMLLWDLSLPLLVLVFALLALFDKLPRVINSFANNYFAITVLICAVVYFLWRYIYKSHMSYNERVKEEVIRNGYKYDIDIIKEKCKQKIKFKKHTKEVQ